MISPDYYFRRFGLFPQFITEPPSVQLGLVVVIPCFNEPFLPRTLDSLWNCSRPSCDTEIIVVINSPAGASQEIILQNRKTLAEINEWKSSHQDTAFRCFSIHIPELPPKTAGAGLARKAGMDEAVRRFQKAGNPDGIIVSFDADAVADRNYLTEIENLLRTRPSAKGCSVYFEHPTGGNEYSPEIYHAVTSYELFLRYYRRALHYSGFPYSFHTVGSCFAIKSPVYMEQGGMNTKKAGEDFYFLHKVIPRGNFYDLNTTRVVPSPRLSARVPFGTGTAIKKMVETKRNSSFPVYQLSSYLSLIPLLREPEQLFGMKNKEKEIFLSSLPVPLKIFLAENNFVKVTDEINCNCCSEQTFRKKFFHWFNAFRILKYLNAVHKTCYTKSPVEEESLKLLELIKPGHYGINDTLELLKIYRIIEKDSPNFVP
jgi:glycosyltransferase involved in cell wall biosynthesis